MDKVKQLKSLLNTTTDDKFNRLIPRAFLGLDDNQIETVSFVFWLCYLVETKMEEFIKEAVSPYKTLLTEDVRNVLKDEHKVDFGKLDYFADKIKIYEATVGKNEFSKILWEINDIRNDVSHNRTLAIKYKKEDLFLRDTKERLFLDLVSSMVDQGIVFK